MLRLKISKYPIIGCIDADFCVQRGIFLSIIKLYQEM